MLVSHCSTFFRSECEKSWDTHSHKNPFHIKFPEDDARFAKAILRFIYGDRDTNGTEFTTDEDEMRFYYDLVLAAHKYGVDDLAENPRECMVRMVSDLDIAFLIACIGPLFNWNNSVRGLGLERLVIEDRTRKTLVDILLEKRMPELVKCPKSLQDLRDYPNLAVEIVRRQNAASERNGEEASQKTLQGE